MSVNGTIVDKKLYTHIMKYFFYLAVFALPYMAAAQQNHNEAGMHIGTLLVWQKLPGDNEYYSESGGVVWGIFYERQFDKKQKRIYPSVIALLNGCSFGFAEVYKKEYFDSSMSYPEVRTDTSYGQMRILSLGVGAGVNLELFRKKRFGMRLQAAVLPVAETGNFEGRVKFNIGGSLGCHFELGDHILLGIKLQQMFDGYWSDLKNVPVQTKYVPGCMLLDLRYRWRG